ncbi:MAG: hypothetical protein M3M85_00900 [bacterium]|nr:hypothetical protein [bacterium]
MDRQPTITPDVSPGETLEIFEGDMESKMNQLVSWIDKRVKRKQWNNEEIAKKFARRNTKEILKDGDTGFMNSCNDLTLVAYALLKKNGFKPALVVQKIRPKKYSFVHMHFALEFSEKDNQYTLEFAQKGQVLLTRGEYIPHREDIETLQIQKVDTDIALDQNMESVLGGKIDLSDLDLEQIIAQLQKDNVPQAYTNYMAQLPENGSLYLDSCIEN